MSYEERHVMISEDSISIKDLFSIFSAYLNDEVILPTAEIFNENYS